MTNEEAIEIYKDIDGYKGEYQISNFGNVYSLKRKKKMSNCISNNGYLQVNLTHNGKSKSYKVHRLVATAFLDNPFNLPEVNHKDENKMNNCVDNLEWCTKEYNLNYNGGQFKRARSRNYESISKKRSIAQSKEIMQLDYDGEIVAIWKNAYIAEQHGYNRTVINQCCLGNKKSHKGYLWKYSSYIGKQIPKKPILRKCDNADCPCCGHSVNAFITTYDYYCGRCGQKLDWGESE